jgi:hypothetical protein
LESNDERTDDSAGALSADRRSARSKMISGVDADRTEPSAVYEQEELVMRQSVVTAPGRQ